MQTFCHRRRGQRHSCVDTRGIAIPFAVLMGATLWQLAHADGRFDFPSSTENMKSTIAAGRAAAFLIKSGGAGDDSAVAIAGPMGKGCIQICTKAYGNIAFYREF